MQMTNSHFFHRLPAVSVPVEIRIQAADFSVADEWQGLRARCAGSMGAVASFVGLVRDRDADSQVTGLYLEHYPGMTEDSIATIITEAEDRWALQDIVVVHRVGLLDESFRHVIDWGLGFVRDSNRYGTDTVPYGFGRHCSTRTFGHGGSQCCVGFADPEHSLAVGLAVNGRPGEDRHQARFRGALTALYEDLQLTRGDS